MRDVTGFCSNGPRHGRHLRRPGCVTAAVLAAVLCAGLFMQGFDAVTVLAGESDCCSDYVIPGDVVPETAETVLPDGTWTQEPLMLTEAEFTESSAGNGTGTGMHGAEEEAAGPVPGIEDEAGAAGPGIEEESAVPVPGYEDGIGETVYGAEEEVAEFVSVTEEEAGVSVPDSGAEAGTEEPAEGGVPDRPDTVYDIAAADDGENKDAGSDDDSDYSIKVLADTDYTVEVTGTFTLNGTGWSQSSSDGGEVKLSSRGNQTTVTGWTPGTVTLRRGFTSYTVTVSDTIRVYVYVSSADFSDEMLYLLGIDRNTIDASGYFPAGMVYLDASYLSDDAKKSAAQTESRALINSEEDWALVLADLANMYTGEDIFADSYKANAGNNVSFYIEDAANYLNNGGNSGATALFRMSGGEGYIDSTVNFHLDLLFHTAKVTFRLDDDYWDSEGHEYDHTIEEERVYIQNAVLREPSFNTSDPNKFPAGYKIAEYYYLDENREKVNVNFNVDRVRDDMVIYISLIKDDTVLINYMVAQGEGTLSRFEEDFELTNGKAPEGEPVGSVASAGAGYRFDGWYADSGCTILLSRDMKYVPPEPDGGWSGKDRYVFYAKFTPLDYTVAVEKTDRNTGRFLPEAEFIIYRIEYGDSGQYPGDEPDETLLYYSGGEWVNERAGAEMFTTDVGGRFEITLNVGSFFLEEVKAPEGYAILSEPVMFMITAVEDTDGGMISIPDDEQHAYADNTGGMKLTVVNYPGRMLPETGGPGIVRSTAVGLFLMLGAGLPLFRFKRKRSVRET